MSHEYSEKIHLYKIMNKVIVVHTFMNMYEPFYRAKIIIGGAVACLLILMCGCSNNKTQDNNTDSFIETEEKHDDIANAIDLPISVNIVHESDPDLPQPDEYCVVNNSDEEIEIDIKSDYYNQYMSGNRFNAPCVADFSYIDDVEYLTLELDIVNNTKERISVNELNVNVERSELDKFPLIYVCTSYVQSNSIQFVNGSWFNWKGFTFSYSILKKGQEFSGTYNKSIHIPYFDDVKTVNLLQDLKELGYDFDNLLKQVQTQNEISGFYDGNPWITENGNQYLVFWATDKDDINRIQSWFYPFEFKRLNEFTYEASATLYGTITFDDTDIVKSFKAEISLSTEGGFGALSYANDKFDVKLHTDGKNYVKRFPYTTVLEPQGAEMVKLRIMAEKSSNHNFFINVINDNGLNIRSKNIKFHNFWPKTNEHN